MPARRASAGEPKARRSPPSAIVPPSAGNTPVRIFTSVLLPAPLAPIRAWTSPWRTASAAARSATTELKFLATSRTSRSGAAVLMPAAPDRSPSGSGGGAFAGENLLHGVGGVGLHVDVDAIERVELGLVDLLQRRE